MKPIDAITDIIREKGSSLRQTDIDEIERLIVDIPIADLPDQTPWIWEAIALIVNAPEYEGDIVLDE